MLTIKSKKITLIFNSVEQLKFHIKEKCILRGELKELRDLNLPDMINSQMTMTNTEFIKRVRRMFNCGGNNKKMYWYNRGFSELESQGKVSEEQSRRSYSVSKEKRIEKAKLAMKAYVKKYQNNFNQFSRFCPEYWLKMGLSLEDAKIKAKETNDETNNREYLKTLYSSEQIKDMDKKKSLPGKRNGMFGRVPSRGTGMGISGFYKNYYFRSSYEYFWIKEMEFLNLEFIQLDDGINSKMKIQISENKTYTADFFIPSTRTMIDIKNDYGIKKIESLKSAIQSYCLSHDIHYETIHKNEIKIDWNMMNDDICSGAVVLDKNKQEKYKRALNANSSINKISL